MVEKPFNPLDKVNLGISIVNAIYSSEAKRLSDIESFPGAGVYAIYYKGSFPEYNFIISKNKSEFILPIYAGKAVPDGARKGGVLSSNVSGPYLFKRLNDHKKSIEQTANLSINDFYFRYLLVDDIWIPLGEALLIEKYKPLWNTVLDGFGNHDPGSGRYKQQVSPWDVLHPGRSWAAKLQDGKAVQEIKKLIEDYRIKYEKK